MKKIEKVPLPRGNKMTLILGVGDKKQRFSCKIRKSVASSYGMSGNMICPKCFVTAEGGHEIHKVEQYYICPSCQNIYKKGELKYRVTDGVVYSEEERKKYLGWITRQEIEMVGVVSLDEILPAIELVSATYELFGEPKAMQGIYTYLDTERLGILVEFGYYGEIRKGIIIPSAKKLLILMLRDSVLVKEPAIEIGNGGSESYNTLFKFAESEKGTKLVEFLEAVRNGTLDEIKPVEEPETVSEDELDTSIFGELGKKKKIVLTVK